MAASHSGPLNPLAIAATAPPSAKGLQTVTIRADRFGGPRLSEAGTADYRVTQQGILNLPQGQSSTLSDVLTQMPGVSIDQNQQIHIRDTEGPQFQYVIDGVMVPLDINTNPPFLSMINPMFVQRIDLLTGVLPARYSYATGGVVKIETKGAATRPQAPSRPCSPDSAAPCSRASS